MWVVFMFFFLLCGHRRVLDVLTHAFPTRRVSELISGDALVTQEFWGITGDAGEGTLMTVSPDPRKNPVAAPVVKKFRDKGIEPEGYVLYTYGTIQAWAQAAEKAGTTDTDRKSVV